MIKREFKEENLFMTLNGEKVHKGSVADIICQGCKYLEDEILETDSECRTLYLLVSLYRGYIYQYIVLGLDVKEAENRAKERVEKMGCYPFEVVLEMHKSEINALRNMIGKEY